MYLYGLSLQQAWISHHISRYMGCYLISLPAEEVEKVVRLAGRMRCPVVDVGAVCGDPVIRLGGKVVVSKAKMMGLIRKTPYRKAKF